MLPAKTCGPRQLNGWLTGTSATTFMPCLAPVRTGSGGQLTNTRVIHPAMASQTGLDAPGASSAIATMAASHGATHTQWCTQLTGEISRPVNAQVSRPSIG